MKKKLENARNSTANLNEEPPFRVKEETSLLVKKEIIEKKEFFMKKEEEQNLKQEFKVKEPPNFVRNGVNNNFLAYQTLGNHQFHSPFQYQMIQTNPHQNHFRPTFNLPHLMPNPRNIINQPAYYQPYIIQPRSNTIMNLNVNVNNNNYHTNLYPYFFNQMNNFQF